MGRVSTEYFTKVCTLRRVLILDGMEVPRLALVHVVPTSTTRNLQVEVEVEEEQERKGGNIMQE